MSKENVSFVAVGDLYWPYDELTMQSALAEIAPKIRAADIAFCNFEGPAGKKGAPKKPLTHLPTPISVLPFAGFDVVSVANNHALDFGREAFLDTLDLLEENKIKHVGGGRNLAEARKPAILKRKDIHVAFLAYASDFDYLLGAHASTHRPGIVPLRVDPLLEPPQVDEEGLEAMVEDIKAAKAKADIVVVSHHWGISCSHSIALSQKAIAYASIDAGATMILGYHPHVLQAIELYKDGVICYSLGNFMPAGDKYIETNTEGKVFVAPFFEGSEETNNTMLLSCAFSDKQIKSAYFSPILINGQGQPVTLLPEHEKFKTIFEMMNKLSKKLGTSLTVEEDKVWIIKD